MNAKEYLGQVDILDREINAKLAQVTAMRALAVGATSRLTDMPRSSSPEKQTLARLVAKIADLEAEVDKDVDALIDLRVDILSTLARLHNKQYASLLDMRYLQKMPLKRIARSLNYRGNAVYNAHALALESLDELLALDARMNLDSG